ncbi:type 4a pilus biogenesis protein PilO [Shewanella sp. D64]|uniref:type 4a pilus biogenesis protein PilO n=1 Tax=unclassified Shewanella TaxID=196818 RepID=UPI0022BA3A3E|nr:MULTISPECIES: type 4a pilus biogenesis protein PilO [unclassified Shewanella]MEC4728478.1 type 4a pilus biogenesis protein PilO [Shewanella sp. D64]MEC4740490.1 type 4a pilus biogenesis protein PilO [Shewanella sp. E94]WBJ95155.1 type 4a pilus biogenesis protein PilO [Shewanella sp. MTB7]
MNLDLNQFNDIDFENVGGWPSLVKVVFAAILSVCILVASYFLFFSDAMALLDKEQQTELALREDFKSKYQLAANLKLYREQLEIMEAQFAQLLKMLPSKNEMPGLLDDLTFVATDSGLKIDSLDWREVIQRDFYIEFPISMAVSGEYHELGQLVSGVAKLPRIVSLHDFVIKKLDNGGLGMEILAKTYRFKEGTDLPDKKKGAK